jgi:serine/threonine-protein kinase RsbW
MPTVEVSFTALPGHVRTARLVALAVARRAGVPEELLDEVRLAVGEACSRSVGVHQSKAPDAPIVMRLIDEHDRFVVEVLDSGPFEEAIGDPALDSIDPESLAAPASREASVEPLPDILPPGFGLAVISGLVEDVSVTSDPEGTRVRMAWPAAGDRLRSAGGAV